MTVSKVVELRPALACDDMVKVLRNIADDIEAGKYDFDPKFGALVLATETERRDRDGVTLGFRWQTHGLGKCGIFAAKGMLAAAAASFDGEKDV